MCAKFPGKKKCNAGAAESHHLGGLKWGKWNLCLDGGGGQNCLQGPLVFFSDVCGPQTCTISQWDFKTLEAKLPGEHLEKKEIKAETFCLALALPALMVGGSLHPTQIFQVGLGFVCPLFHPQGCLLACAWNVPSFINRFRKLCFMWQIWFILKCKPDNTDVVSLANISHISACHCNSRRIYESGGAKQAAEQFALSSVLMGLKIMFLSLDLNSKCEISSILPSFQLVSPPGVFNPCYWLRPCKNYFKLSTTIEIINFPFLLSLLFPPLRHVYFG